MTSCRHHYNETKYCQCRTNGRNLRANVLLFTVSYLNFETSRSVSIQAKPRITTVLLEIHVIDIVRHDFTLEYPMHCRRGCLMTQPL
jgi:hypothetical protein